MTADIWLHRCRYTRCCPELQQLSNGVHVSEKAIAIRTSVAYIDSDHHLVLMNSNVEMKKTKTMNWIICKPEKIMTLKHYSKEEYRLLL